MNVMNCSKKMQQDCELVKMCSFESNKQCKSFRQKVTHNRLKASARETNARKRETSAKFVCRLPAKLPTRIMTFATTGEQRKIDVANR